MSLLERFKKLPRWLQIGSFVLLSGVILAAAFFSFIEYEFSPRQTCGSRGSHEYLSSDGRYKAVLYEYDCGATTDFGGFIAIIPSNEKFDPYDADSSKLILSADGDHQTVGVDRNGILPIKVVWLDNAHLKVSVPEKARVFQKRDRLGKISISYSQ